MTTFPTPTKTLLTDLCSWATFNAATSTAQTEVDITSYLKIALFYRVGRRTGSAFTAGWPNLRVECNPASSGGFWTPIDVYQPAIGASIANTTLNGSVSAGAATITVASGTNIAGGDLLYLSDTTASNFEIIRVASISGTTVTPEEVVVNAHANSAIVTDQAEMSGWRLFDVSMFKRIRGFVDNFSGQAIAGQIQMMGFN